MSGDDAADALFATLENAGPRAVYARTIGERWRSVANLDDSRALPLLDKPTAIQHQHELIVGHRRRVSGSLSSARLAQRDLPASTSCVLRKTGGDPRRAVRSRVEGDDRTIRIRAGPDRGRCTTACRRSTRRGRDPRAVDLSSKLTLDDRHRAGPDSARWPPCHRDADQRRRIEDLHAWVLEREIDPPATPVKMIGTNGSRSRRFGGSGSGRSRRRALRITTRFRASQTPPPECKSCGALHFGWPPLFWRCSISPRTVPASAGPGRLVLTSVFPFVEKMPLISVTTPATSCRFALACPAAGSEGIVLPRRARRGW